VPSMQLAWRAASASSNNRTCWLMTTGDSADDWLIPDMLGRRALRSGRRASDYRRRNSETRY
jgi:hypothetical protein